MVLLAWRGPRNRNVFQTPLAIADHHGAGRVIAIL
jgi:hypothetical protein